MRSRRRRSRGSVEALECRTLLSHPVFDVVSYSPPYPPGVPSSISSCIADFNRDGKADTASGDSRGVTVALSNGDGTFTTSFYDFNAGCIVTAADFNGDGRPDLAVVLGFISSTEIYLRMMLNSGNGAFTPLADRSIGPGPAVSTAAGDFDGDGNADLVILRDAGSSPGIGTALLGNGDGTFADATVDVSTRPHPSKVMSADFDGDGKADLAVLSSDSRSLQVFHSDGDGSFAAAMEYVPNSFTSDIAIGDFNGDGRPDLAVSASRGVRLLLNHGDGSFSESISYTLNPDVNAYYTRIIAADFNGDGAVDLASGSRASYYGNDFALVLNDGTGRFGAPIEYPYGPSGYAVMVAGDFNGDGKIDLKWSGGSGGVLLNAGDSGFRVRTDYLGASTRPGRVFAADFNDDGKADIVASSSTVGPRIFLSRGDGSFGSGLYGGVSGTLLAVADLNGDGKPDLVMGSGGTLSVRFNSGNGTFAAPVVCVTVPDTYYSPNFEVAVADFDGDGHLDLAAAAYLGNTFIVLNNGDGTFAAVGEYPGADFLSAADFDGDGTPDLAMVKDGSLIVRTNSGDGTFDVSGEYAAGSGAVTIADFNGDGVPDIAVGAKLTGTGLSLLINQGDGTFSPAVQYPHAISSIVAADFNGDGKPDLAGTDYSGQSFNILLNEGDGTFGAPQLHSSGGGPMGAVVADVNGDGKPDLAWANFWSNSFSVMQNVSSPPVVQSARFDYDGPRQTLRFQISGEVWETLSTANVVVTTLPGGSPVGVMDYSHDPATHEAIFTLPTPLPDGNYRATLLAAGAHDPDGTPLAADYSFEFFVLAADANRDRRVDVQDLSILAANWMRTGMTFSQGDFNYDGIVNKLDLKILATRWHVQLDAPAEPAAPSPSPTGAARRSPTRTPTRIADQVLT